MINNFFKHFHTINKHRFLVLKLCIKAGIPFRGLVHDLSKYSPTEFFEGVKYFNGKKSPIHICKQRKGYSKAWLHHKGRNKHHFEYWIDINTPNKTPMMPYKYTVEMICDNIAAGMVYNGKNWNSKCTIEYFQSRKDLNYINESTKKVLEEVYTHLKNHGLDKTLNKKYLKRIYDKYAGDNNETI